MKSIRILLIDDAPSFLRATTLVIHLERGEEIEVIGTAESGEEGLKMARQLEPQIVLVDLCMPGLSGLEVIPRLRAMRPETGIIAVTLLDADAYRSAALEAGADEFVSKARLETEIVPAICRVARARRMQEPARFSPVDAGAHFS